MHTHCFSVCPVTTSNTHAAEMSGKRERDQDDMPSEAPRRQKRGDDDLKHMNESWNMTEVAALLVDLPPMHRDRHALQQVALANGVIDVTYRHGPGRSSGRMYAAGVSLQKMTRMVRSRRTFGGYTHLDIRNCFPVLLQQVLERNEIECSELHYYNTHREEIFELLVK
jgi:hypothetical protein